MLKDIASGYQAGTVIKAKHRSLKAKKSWIAFSKKLKGAVFINAKAAEALMNEGKSLLAVGITKVNGNFKRGDTVSVSSAETGKDFARGLINYDSEIIDMIKGKKSSEIGKLINASDDEVIHRDNLVIL